jgi:hypothetical protein
MPQWPQRLTLLYTNWLVVFFGCIGNGDNFLYYIMQLYRPGTMSTPLLMAFIVRQLNMRGLVSCAHDRLGQARLGCISRIL